MGRGTGCRDREMEEFKAFFEEADLVDFPCIGGKFFWFNSTSSAMSRLDGFLNSENIINSLKVVK